MCGLSFYGFLLFLVFNFIFLYGDHPNPNHAVPVVVGSNQSLRPKCSHKLIPPVLPRQHMLKHFKGGEGKGEFPEAFNQIGMHTDVVSRQRSSSPWETPSSLIPLVH